MNSRKDKGKVFKEHILKDLVLRGFDSRITEIQEEHRQAFMERDDRIQTTQCENVGLQSEMQAKDQEIAALQRRHTVYLENKDKNNFVE